MSKKTHQEIINQLKSDNLDQKLIDRATYTAKLLEDWGLDEDAIACGALIDVSDLDIFDDYSKMISSETMVLLEEVSRLIHIHDHITEDADTKAGAEKLRRLLVSLSKDLRTLFIILAHRTSMLKTLDKDFDKKKAQRMAQDAIQVYAPLADRVGMGALKAELEDLAFPYALPVEYKLIKQYVKEPRKRQQRYIARFKEEIRKQLEEENVDVISIDGRSKHLYSLYKKLNKLQGDISKVYDLVALRVVVPTVSDCYQVMGLIHETYKPLIYRIKDYIAVPKPNGYQSLHTTVFGLDGRITEIQIRTKKMHEEAEHGLAAHFHYDSFKDSKGYKQGQHAAEKPKAMQWVDSIRSLTDNIEELNSTELDLFTDRIFVFTPKGDLFELPEDASVLDFAFEVHTEVGLRTKAIKVNEQIVSLDTKLKNRDIVEVVTRKHPEPSRQWLQIVKTPKARNKLRSWFRKLDREGNVHVGRKSLADEMGVNSVDDIDKEKLKEAAERYNYKSAESMMAGIGEGNVSVSKIVRFIKPKKVKEEAVSEKPVESSNLTSEVIIAGISGLEYKLAKCCEPKPPQKIKGTLSGKHRVTVHKANCDNRTKDPERSITCKWKEA